jgi:hypothetical protein
MAMIKKCGEESLNPKYVYRWLKYKIEFSREHPDYFDADGLLCFAGSQGSGKTISAVNYVTKLLTLYPKCKLVTNLWLPEYPVVTFEQYLQNTIEKDSELDLENDTIRKHLYDAYLKSNRVFLFLDNDDFQKYRNGEYGIIYLVDEIQLYLNSLQSKNINMDVINTISQQRKQRIHIVSTSQVFGRMAKPLREQFSNVILCKNYLKVLQVNKLIDRDSIQGETTAGTEVTGVVKKKFMWFHNPDYYKRYDTYYVVERGKFVARENQLEGVYENAVRLSSDC